MKRFIINIVLILTFIISKGLTQDFQECLTRIPEGVSIEQAKSGNLGLYRRTNFIELRLAIHIVRNSNGQFGISMNELNYKINKLNEYFEQVMFRFNIYHIDTIDSDIYYFINDIDEANSLRQIYNIPGCINVYFVSGMNEGMGLSSFSPRIDQGPQGIIIMNTAHETTLPHEMGHYFDLFHTEQIWIFCEVPGAACDTIYENIVRGGTCKNCDNAGDLLCDTPADPGIRSKGHIITGDCQWVITNLDKIPPDHCGAKNYTPMVANMMQTYSRQCRSLFTQQQKDRMNETLLLYRRDLLGHIVDLRNIIEGENAGGTLHVNDRNYPSGSKVILQSGIYRIGTNEERFVNYKNSGITYKHNNWNKRSSDYFLSRFVSIDTSQNQHAWFHPIRYARIESRLEARNYEDLGEFKFQDPWYVKADGSQPGNYWITAQGFYEPTGREDANEKGVFLNQGYDPDHHTWLPPYYSVRAEAVQLIDLPHTGRVNKFYFQNWSADPPDSALFQNANALETPVVFKNAGVTVSANYKGSLLSNSVNAFAGGTQRKIVRTENGHIHLFYISMNSLWYEKSVNNGAYFYRPKLIEGTDGIIVKNFSVDYVENKIYLVAQVYIEDGGSSEIWFYEIDENANVNPFPDLTYHRIGISDATVDATPVVGANYGNVIFIWKDSKIEPLKLLRFRYDGSTWIKSNIFDITNTTANSINLSISLVKSWQCSKVYSHFVWEEKLSSRRSKIYYTRIMIIRDNENGIKFENFCEVTKGSGYDLATKPTIVETGEDTALVGFVGVRRYELENINPEEIRAVLTSIKWTTDSVITGVFLSYGYDVQNVSINRSGDRWTFAWSRSNDLPIQFVDSQDPRRIKQIDELKGVDVQVTNAAHSSGMFAFAINTKSSPYPINYRLLYPSIQPEEIEVEMAREGIVEKEGGAVYYSIGDIKVGDEKIEFTDIPDTLKTINLENANRYLISKPFMVNDNSGFVYTIRYGVTDSTALKEALTNTDYITFRVELIDANTKEILGVFDEVTYNSENVSKYENINYFVNTDGLGSRLVQLRLVIMNNVDPYYALGDKFSDAEYSLQKKKAFKEVGYRGILSPKEYTYNLTQNYPNPFNPTTKIKYSVKEDKLVTIKLYDMLGREVATLLNEVKSPGEYVIELDAQRLGLSSGVYLYQMKSGEFSSIMKLVFVK